MSEGKLAAAVAAGVLPAEEDFAQLLRSIVVVARSIFAAKASSIFLLDEETDELVFAAVAGEEEQGLVGRRMPSSQGIAGCDPRFSHDVAEQTGYLPTGMMAVPLLYDEEALGVLQVLDRPAQERFSLAEMELLGLFANQAAIALSLLRSARRARAALAGSGDAAAVAALAAAVARLDETRRPAGIALLEALAKILS